MPNAAAHMGAVPPMPVAATSSLPPPSGPPVTPAAATAPSQPSTVATASATPPLSHPQQPLQATQPPPQPHMSENPITPPLAVPTTTPSGKKKPTKVVLIYNNNDISPVSFFHLYSNLEIIYSCWIFFFFSFFVGRTTCSTREASGFLIKSGKKFISFIKTMIYISKEYSNKNLIWLTSCSVFFYT